MHGDDKDVAEISDVHKKVVGIKKVDEDACERM
jgi:hypothetical protein